MTLVINSNTPVDQDEISDNHITKIDGSNFQNKRLYQEIQYLHGVAYKVLTENK